jgi:hypothetical protein
VFRAAKWEEQPEAEVALRHYFLYYSILKHLELERLLNEPNSQQNHLTTKLAAATNCVVFSERLI